MIWRSHGVNDHSLHSTHLLCVTAAKVVKISWVFTYVPIADQAVSPWAGSQGSPEFGMSGARCIIHATQATTRPTIETHTSHKCRNIVRDELVLYNVRSVWVIRGQCVATRGAQQRCWCCINHRHLSIFWSSRSVRAEYQKSQTKIKSWNHITSKTFCGKLTKIPPAVYT